MISVSLFCLSGKIHINAAGTTGRGALPHIILVSHKTA